MKQLRWIVTIMLALAVVIVPFSFSQVGAAWQMHLADTNTAQPVPDQYATITTTAGVIKVRLYGTQVPITVRNFDKLAESGYYNGLTFHRVIKGFMIQGGDNGKGGPGYHIPDEIRKNLNFDSAGYLAMANAGPNTGNAQFFITVEPTPWLNGKHTIFGTVVSGMDVVKKINAVQTDSVDRPVQPITIKSITITPIKYGSVPEHTNTVEPEGGWDVGHNFQLWNK